MMRALLVLLLVLLARAEAFESVRQIRFESSLNKFLSALELEMPGDSDLVVDSTTLVGGARCLWGRMVATGGRHDSIWRLRHLFENALHAKICFGADTATCIAPQEYISSSEIFYNGMADCFPQMKGATVQGPWDLGSALAALRKKMSSVEDWGVYRTQEVMARRIGVQGGNLFPNFNLKNWYWESPWSRLDSLVGKGQWYRAEAGFEGSKGDTFVFLAAYPWYWKIGPGTDGDRNLKAVGRWFLTAPSYESSCDPQAAASGTRRLLTGRNGSYAIVDDSLQLDTLLRIKSYTYGIDSLVLRARIALKDLDSLLRNPPPVGIVATAAPLSALRLAGGLAELDAGGVPGRLELVDARGQILSMISGTGRLSLALRGKGVRWVRWKRGAEQGAVPVVF